MWQARGKLEALGQADEEGATRAKLRGPYAHPGAVADQIDLVQQIDDVEAHFDPPKWAGCERLDDAEVDLLISGQASPVGSSARVGGPETASSGQVDRNAGIPGRVLVLDAGRRCVRLVVIEMDVVAGDKSQFVRVEVELRRNDVFSLGFRSGEVAVEGPVFDVVAEGQFDAANKPLVVIERGQEDRRAELAFVEQVAGNFVIGFDPRLEPGQDDLTGADIEVV